MSSLTGQVLDFGLSELLALFLDPDFRVQKYIVFYLFLVMKHRNMIYLMKSGVSARKSHKKRGSEGSSGNFLF